MKSLFWKIRGVANNSSKLPLKRLIHSNLPDLVFIAEPWIDFDKFSQKWLNRFDLNSLAFNEREVLLPNISCFCKTKLNPHIVKIDYQHVSITLNTHNITIGFFLLYMRPHVICIEGGFGMALVTFLLALLGVI